MIFLKSLFSSWSLVVLSCCQTELDKERMALELQEEKKAQVEKERRLKEQEQKIENLSTMVINSAVDDRDLDKRSKKVCFMNFLIYSLVFSLSFPR